MKAKHYTIEQLAALKGETYDAIAQQLYRDSKKMRNKRKYPNAYKTECCDKWMIPERDLKS